jgi:two-component system sensor histidine kinase UhpB
MIPLLRPELIDIGYMYPGRWRHMADTYADIGVLPRNFSLDGFLYDPNPNLDLTWLYRSLVAALLLTGVVSAVALYIERNNRKLARALTERKLAESMLNQRTAEVKEAYRKLAETEEQERRALARELHDQVSQNLSALNLNLNRLNSEFAGSLAGEPRKRISDSLTLVEDTAQRIRDVMSYLRPPVLDDYGLFATLRWWVHESATRSGIAIELTGAEAEPRLPNDVELALFRVAQEALLNAIKHSGAKHITVSYEMLPGRVRLGISDDGRGVVPDAGREASVRSTWGILNMRERAEAIGGSLRIESVVGAGTRIVVEVARDQP